jgi:hypothetical protein
MTICYNDFYSAYDSGRFKTTTTLGVKLVDNSYIPDVSHKPANVTGIILTATGVLTWSEFQANGMSWILQTLENRAENYKNLHPEKVEPGESLENIKYYVVYSAGLSINLFCEEVTNG